MKVTSNFYLRQSIDFQKEKYDPLAADVPRLAPKQVDLVTDVNYKGPKENHRISFRYNEELGRTVAHFIHNSTGEVVKVLPTETEVDHLLRLQRLKGIAIDKKV